MASNIKKSIRAVLGFFLAGAFLYAAFRGTNFSDLWKSLQNVNYGWVMLLIPIHVASHWLRAVRWSYLLAPVKKNLSKRNLFSAVMVGFMVNNALPRVGEFVRPYVIGKLEGISKSSAFATVVVERIIDMATFMFTLCLVLFINPNTLDPFVSDPASARPIFLVGSIASLAAFVILFLKSESLFKLLNLFKPIVPKKFDEQFDRIVESFLSGLGVARMRDKFFPIVLLSLLIWLAYALGLYVPFFAFDSLANLHLDFGASVILLTISTIAWVLPAPGALGTYHTFLTVALIKLYGVDSITALSFSIITHETGYIIVTVLGLYYFFKDHLKVSEVTLETADGKTA
ncbi:MAG: flippase-like domain-containing protein [Ignavibacteriales bacterium]|nr:flippase-like domain-containing protein [Ignavibacteriales bacterium]